MPEVKDEVVQEIEESTDDKKKLEEIKSAAKEAVKEVEVKEEVSEGNSKDLTTAVEASEVEANGNRDHTNGYTKETNGHTNGSVVDKTEIDTKTDAIVESTPTENKAAEEAKTEEALSEGKVEDEKTKTVEEKIQTLEEDKSSSQTGKEQELESSEADSIKPGSTELADSESNETAEGKSTENPSTVDGTSAESVKCSDSEVKVTEKSETAPVTTSVPELEESAESKSSKESAETKTSEESIESKSTEESAKSETLKEPVEIKSSKESAEIKSSEESAESKSSEESIEYNSSEESLKPKEKIESKTCEDKPAESNCKTTEPAEPVSQTEKMDDTAPPSLSVEGTAGGSKEPATIPTEISDMISEGRICLLKNNFNGAADLLGTACEKMRELFGELHDVCGPVYYYYGWAMLECAKIEEDVLGEEVKKKEGEEEEESEDEVEGEKESEKQDVPKEEDGSEPAIEKIEESKEQVEIETAKEEEAAIEEEEAMETDVPEADETLKKEGDEEEEEEDTTLKAAWETLELAKIIFERQSDQKMLADVFMKLGEVAVESGHKEGIDDMKRSLELRTEVYPATHRAIPETHFNIGLSYSLFQLFDDAIHHFTLSKALLKQRIDSLANETAPDALDEVKELKELLPEIDDKIRDMNESKVEKAKAECSLKGTPAEVAAGTAAPASALNASLIKRKRKIAEVASELPDVKAKQAKQES